MAVLHSKGHVTWRGYIWSMNGCWDEFTKYFRFRIGREGHSFMIIGVHVCKDQGDTQYFLECFLY